MTRNRESLAIGTATDIYGDDWLVAEERPTAHGFTLLLGWPVDAAGPGGARVIMTAALAEHLQTIERPQDVDLPVGRSTIKRLRAELDLRFDWDAWWAARQGDLATLSLSQFAAKHNCSVGATSQRRADMRSAGPSRARRGARP